MSAVRRYPVKSTADSSQDVARNIARTTNQTATENQEPGVSAPMGTASYTLRSSVASHPAQSSAQPGNASSAALRPSEPSPRGGVPTALRMPTEARLDPAASNVLARCLVPGRAPTGESKKAEVCNKHLQGRCRDNRCPRIHLPPIFAAQYLAERNTTFNQTLHPPACKIHPAASPTIGGKQANFMPFPRRSVNMTREDCAHIFVSSAALPQRVNQAIRPPVALPIRPTGQPILVIGSPSQATMPPKGTRVGERQIQPPKETVRSPAAMQDRTTMPEPVPAPLQAERSLSSISTSSMSSVAEVDPTKASGAPSIATESEVEGKEVCRNFLDDRCRSGARCPRYHPPRYEWSKYIRSDKPCSDHEQGICALGANCWLSHLPKSLDISLPRPPQRVVVEFPASRGVDPARTSADASTNLVQKSASTQTVKGKEPAKVDNDGGLSLPTQPSSATKSGSKRARKARGPKSDTAHSVLSGEPDGSSSESTSNTSLDPRRPVEKSKTAIASIGRGNLTKSQETCKKFLRGHCSRPKCPYSHVVVPNDIERLFRPLLQPLAAGHAPQASGSNTASKALPSSSRDESRIIPRVPPGLGIKQEVQVQSIPAESFVIHIEASQVTFGHGFEVKGVQTGFETRKVLLKNVPTAMDRPALEKVLLPFGALVDVQLPDPRPTTRTMSVRATFATHTEAAAAVAALDSTRIRGSTISVMLGNEKSTGLGKGILNDGDVYIEFPAPSRAAFIGFSTREKATEAISTISQLVKDDVQLDAELYDGLPKVSVHTVIVRGLPPTATVKDLSEFKSDGEPMLGPASSYHSVQKAARSLQTLLERYGDLVSINILPPPYYRQTVRAWAHFSTPTAAEVACAAVNGTRRVFLDNGSIFASHSKSISYMLPHAVFMAIKDDILELRTRQCSFREQSEIRLYTKDRDDPESASRVKILAQSLPVLYRLKRSFEVILRGEPVLQDRQPLWHPFFDRVAGRAFVNDLERRWDMLINRDTRRRTISLFGRPDKRAAAYGAIVAQVRYLREQKSHAIPLDGRLIGLFMSADLMKLQRDVGRENVELDLRNRVLRVRGSDEVLHATEDVLRRVRQRHPLEMGRRGNECPVCFSEVTLGSLPVTLPCGHAWCKDCLRRYMVATIDTRVFPLKCLGNEARCTHTITLSVARDVLSPSDYSAVARAAFLTYIQSRPKEFHYCPTPDCPQIYRRSPPNTVLQCPSCLVRICGNCHVEYHEGASCPDPEADKKLYDDWVQNHDVKPCPGCHAPIERSEGCNHMHCPRCKTHMCWKCLATFETDREVYAHMTTMHGDFGL